MIDYLNPLTENQRIAMVLAKNGFSYKAAAVELKMSRDVLLKRVLSSADLRTAICNQRRMKNCFYPYGVPNKLRRNENQNDEEQ